MTTWSIDPAHTTIQFSIKHMMITTVRGQFSDVSGTITFDEEDPRRSSVEARVGAASIHTGAEQRDNHLRSADFFDAQRYPDLTFRSSSVEADGDRWRISGDLAIKGIARPIVLDAELTGLSRGMDGKRRAGFEARGTINRKDWGLNWNVALEAGGWLVGDDVRIELDVQAMEVAAIATAPTVTTRAGDARVAA